MDVKRIIFAWLNSNEILDYLNENLKKKML